MKISTVKLFRYHDIRASSYCELPKSFCSPTSVVNKQNDDNYCFLLSILTHNYKVMSIIVKEYHIIKHFLELSQGDNQFPMKIKKYTNI